MQLHCRAGCGIVEADLSLLKIEANRAPVNLGYLSLPAIGAIEKYELSS
jgi:hypothetical protein